MQKGFIKIILLIVITLIVLSFFNVKIAKLNLIFESGVFKENIDYILQAIGNVVKQAKGLL